LNLLCPGRRRAGGRPSRARSRVSSPPCPISSGRSARRRSSRSRALPPRFHRVSHSLFSFSCALNVVPCGAMSWRNCSGHPERVDRIDRDRDGDRTGDHLHEPTAEPGDHRRILRGDRHRWRVWQPGRLQLAHPRRLTGRGRRLHTRTTGHPEFRGGLRLHGFLGACQPLTEGERRQSRPGHSAQTHQALFQFK